MYYYNPNKPTGRRAAWIATAVYVAIWGVLMFLVVFPAPEKPEFGNGMLIDFGMMEDAGGRDDTPASELDAATASPESTPQATEQMLTADDEDAPVIEQQKREEASTTVSDQRTTRPAEQSQPAPERKVNPKAMYPGRTVGSTSTSEGQTEGQGNQGEEGGSPAGSHEGSGQGDISVGGDLIGRTKREWVVKPVYPPINEEGKVVVEVTVRADGSVISARCLSMGTTTSKVVLQNAALEAARKTRFLPSETHELQTGTITYIFKFKH